MDRTMPATTATPTSGAVTSVDPAPYRAPRLGSGVQCSAFLGETEGRGVGQEGRCESALTTRLRGGVDVHGRPIGEYLCETCGSIFVAITVGLDTRLRFGDVAVDPMDMEHHEPVSLATALRRTDRLPRQIA